MLEQRHTHLWKKQLIHEVNTGYKTGSCVMWRLVMYLLLILLVYAPISAGTSYSYTSPEKYSEILDDSGPPGSSSQTAGAVGSAVEAEQQTVSEGAEGESKSEKPVPVFAIKNNLLYDAILTPNITFETKLAKRWTLQVGGGFNPFPLDDAKDHKWRHFLVGAEAKYWFCEAFRRDFIGINAAYSHYNVAKGWYPVGWIYPAVKNYRFQGDAVMAGVSYGWSFVVSRHVAFELEAGVDAGYTWYSKYECPHCGALVAQEKKWFAAPKAGVNISILLPGADEDDCPCRKQKDEGLASAEQTEPAQAEPAESYESHEPNETHESHETQVSAEPIPEPVAPEPQPVLSAPERLNNPVLCAYSEYRPYSTDEVLSKDSTALYVYFRKDSTTINPAYMGNAEVMDEILYLVDELMKDSLSEMKLIQIVGFASFDGPTKKNEALAQNRAQALKNFIQAHVDVPDSLFELNSGGEAWAELEWALEQSDYKLKKKALKIIREERDPYKRELKLKELNYGWTYVFLRDQLLAKYRNAGYIKVYYDKVE